MRIAIYTRKSVYVERSESIETQLKLCKEFFHGEHEFEVFEDEGFSGKNTNRPAFQRLMQLCEMKKFEVVAVYKVDRIARNIVDFVNIYDELNKLNIKLISTTEGFDPSTTIGKMMMMLLASFADMERANIAQRVRDNMLQLAKKGFYTGGVVPRGCEVEKNNGKSYLKIVDKELVNLLFNSYLEKGSLFLGYKNLVQLGITISREGYRKVLRNPVYVKSSREVSEYLKLKGYEVIGKVNNTNGYMTYGKNIDSPIAIVGKHEAVLDSNKWLDVQIKLDTRKDKFKTTSEVNFLSSILKCPYCGGFYHIAVANGIRYYVCQNRVNRSSTGIDKSKAKCENKKYIKADLIEKNVSVHMKLLEDKKLFEKHFKQNGIEKNSNIARLEKEINKNEKSINSLVDKMDLLSKEAAKPLAAKIEILTSKNLELKNRMELEKLSEIQKKANQNSLEFKYNKVIEFNKLNSSKEKKNVIALIFKEIIFDSFTNAYDYIP